MGPTVVSCWRHVPKTQPIVDTVPEGAVECAAETVADALTGRVTLTRLPEPEPDVPLATDPDPRSGSSEVAEVLVVCAVEPVTLTGAYAFRSVPLAFGFELRPTTTAAGTATEPVDGGDPSVSRTLLGVRTVTSGRPPFDNRAVLPNAAPCPTVTVIGAVADCVPAPDPCALAVAGAVTEMNGPVDGPSLDVPDVPAEDLPGVARAKPVVEVEALLPDGEPLAPV